MKRRLNESVCLLLRFLSGPSGDRPVVRLRGEDGLLDRHHRAVHQQGASERRKHHACRHHRYSRRHKVTSVTKSLYVAERHEEDQSYSVS